MEERCKNKITQKRVIKEEIEVLDQKPLHYLPSRIDPLVNKVGVQGYQKNPSSLIYPMYLNPLSSNFQWTSPSHIFTSYLDPAISSKLHLLVNGFLQYFPTCTKTSPKT